MKQVIDLPSGKVRLWRDEPPIAAYEPLRVIERGSVIGANPIALSTASVAMEVWLHMGPRRPRATSQPACSIYRK